MDTSWLLGGIAVLTVAALWRWWYVRKQGAEPAFPPPSAPPCEDSAAPRPGQEADATPTGLTSSPRTSQSAGEVTAVADIGERQALSDEDAPVLAPTATGADIVPQNSQTRFPSMDAGDSADCDPTLVVPDTTPAGSEQIAANTVLVKATAVSCDQASRALAQARAELWANRRLLGNQACEPLQSAIANAQEALDSWYLAHFSSLPTADRSDPMQTLPPTATTDFASALANADSALPETVETAPETTASLVAASASTPDAGTHLPLPAAVRDYLQEIERQNSRLAPLRYSSFTPSLPATPSTVAEDVNQPQYVSAYPAGGLLQFVEEINASLPAARLQVARLSPTAGSLVSTQLRCWITQANLALATVKRELTGAVPATLTRRQQRRLEDKLLGAIWRRRLIDEVVQYRHAQDWANTGEDDQAWFELAQLAAQITELQADLLLREGAVAQTDLATLASIRTRTTTRLWKECPHRRTSSEVVARCEQLWQRWRSQLCTEVAATDRVSTATSPQDLQS